MINPMIDRALNALPSDLLDRSGGIFYSGKQAFEQPTEIYILGLNPGGDPAELKDHTVRKSLAHWRQNPELYSAYIDDLWKGTEKGASGMQPRLQHLAEQMDIELGTTPSANVIFARTKDEIALGPEQSDLLSKCWPVHQAVIDALSIRMVICLGSTAGNWVRQQLSAHDEVDNYIETYPIRRWASAVHIAADGKMVATLAHPSRANWSSPDADPSTMVKRALSKYS